MHAQHPPAGTAPLASTAAGTIPTGSGTFGCEGCAARRRAAPRLCSRAGRKGAVRMQGQGQASDPAHTPDVARRMCPLTGEPRDNSTAAALAHWAAHSRPLTGCAQASPASTRECVPQEVATRSLVGSSRPNSRLPGANPARRAQQVAGQQVVASSRQPRVSAVMDAGHTYGRRTQGTAAAHQTAEAHPQRCPLTSEVGVRVHVNVKQVLPGQDVGAARSLPPAWAPA